MLDMEIVPDIGIIDGMTKRQELEESEKVSPVQFQSVVRLAGTGKITEEAVALMFVAMLRTKPKDGEWNFGPVFECLREANPRWVPAAWTLRRLCRCPARAAPPRRASSASDPAPSREGPRPCLPALPRAAWTGGRSLA